MNQDSKLMEKIVALCKRRGFIFAGSEIYGGLANTYDYGPAGVELLRNIKNLWWSTFVQQRDDLVGLDSSIILTHKVWDASGHTSGFTDAMIDCKSCKLRKRADHLIEDYFEANHERLLEEVKHYQQPSNLSISYEAIVKYIEDNKVEGATLEQLYDIINLFRIPCPNCESKVWTEVRKFNLLFPVNLGIIEGEGSLAYLRGETAQGIFINFKNVLDSNRVRLPFGIGQIGKSFRNEITLGNFIFRTIEFEQGEIEYFFDPEQSNWEELYDGWKMSMWDFVTKSLGVKVDNLRWRTHSDEERSFYSKRTEDLEYKYPFGFKEVWGLAYRTDYDLNQHMKHSNQDLSVLDPQTGKKIVPYVIEPAVGINRLFLMILCDAYSEDSDRVVLNLDPRLAPYKAAVFPLLPNKEELVQKAKEVYQMLLSKMMVAWDDRGNIGKRYASQDEIGTPFCITVDFDTLEDGTVTVRDRDTREQQRIQIDELPSFLDEKIN